MHASKDSMWHEILKNFTNFFATKLDLTVVQVQWFIYPATYGIMVLCIWTWLLGRCDAGSSSFLVYNYRDLVAINPPDTQLSWFCPVLCICLASWCSYSFSTVDSRVPWVTDWLKKLHFRGKQEGVPPLCFCWNFKKVTESYNRNSRNKEGNKKKSAKLHKLLAIE